MICLAAVVVILAAFAVYRFLLKPSGQGGEKTARDFVTELYTVTPEQYDAYAQVMLPAAAGSGETASGMQSLDADAITAYFTDRFGGYLTEDAMQTGMANRFLTRGLDLYREAGAATTVQGIELKPVENAGGDAVYNYTVTVQAGDATQTAAGQLVLAHTDKAWKISGINRA